MTPVNLFEAKDFRSYLATLLESERQDGKGVSLKSFADRIGVGLSTFKMVLDGSRNLTIKNIHVIAVGLNLTASERDFFESMVLRDQADEEDVRKYYAQKLKQVKSLAKTARLRTSDANIMQDWYVPAFLIYMLDIEKIHEQGISEEAFMKAATAFNLPVTTLKQIFISLEKSGVLQKTSDSKYHIVFERVNGSLTKQRFIQSTAVECQKRIASSFDDPRAMFTAHTLSIPDHLIAKFYDDYKSLVDSYMSYESSFDDNIEILQVCCQSVPVLKKSRTQGKLSSHSQMLQP